MRIKFCLLLIGLVGCTSFFHGCAGLQKEPVRKTYFDLTINLPGSDPAFITRGKTILIKQFDINPVFDSHAFVYRVGENEYTTDYYNEFISYPAKLITDKIEESLSSTQQFRSVQTNLEQDIVFRLSGKILQLYGAFQDTHHPKAIIEIRMTLEKRLNSSFLVISDKTYLAEETIASKEPALLASGWNAGLSKIVARFIQDFDLLNMTRD